MSSPRGSPVAARLAMRFSLETATRFVRRHEDWLNGWVKCDSCEAWHQHRDMYRIEDEVRGSMCFMCADGEDSHYPGGNSDAGEENSEIPTSCPSPTDIRAGGRRRRDARGGAHGASLARELAGDHVGSPRRRCRRCVGGPLASASSRNDAVLELVLLVMSFGIVFHVSGRGRDHSCSGFQCILAFVQRCRSGRTSAAD